MSFSRRKFIQLAAAYGASLAFTSRRLRASSIDWHERRDLYPQGVASGDPHSDSVILWTRHPSTNGEIGKLIVEVAEDVNFKRVVASAQTIISAKTDWTCRVLAARLKPRTIYWYRFTDEHGLGSQLGRTITAPLEKDNLPVSFAFVSCQMVPAGACNAYRRMIWEDKQKPLAERLGFVLHLGDFVYEVVWYPEDRPQGYYARKLRDVVRYPTGEKIRDFHVPATVDDYRALYRGYLSDPDLQEARARWPFVCMWDNHEFSWKGWQSQQDFNGVRPAQTRKVAANQAWFEYQPARVIKKNPDLNAFDVPNVTDAPLTEFDDHGLGLEAGNRSAIDSLKVHRTLRWGKNVELILTDNRSRRSEPVMQRKEATAFQSQAFPYVFSENAVNILDAGRAHRNGKPPATIRFNDVEVPNFRKDEPPQSMLGREQKTWFLQTLRGSSATWKLWGNSIGMVDWRLDFQNLPKEVGPKWPDDGCGTMLIDDWSAYRHERAEILRYIRSHGISGVASICGDRHAFEAGLVSDSLAPDSYDPVIPEFITASISAPGLFESAEYNLPKDHPLRAAFLYQPNGGPVQPAINFSMMHGVRASLALQRTGDLKQALAERNPQVAPQLSFVDVSAHGYAVVGASSTKLDVEFVCIPRPLKRSESEDGGPVTYRMTHRVERWNAKGRPSIKRMNVEGTLPL